MSVVWKAPLPPPSINTQKGEENPFQTPLFYCIHDVTSSRVLHGGVRTLTAKVKTWCRWFCLASSDCQWSHYLPRPSRYLLVNALLPSLTTPTLNKSSKLLAIRVGFKRACMTPHIFKKISKWSNSFLSDKSHGSNDSHLSKHVLGRFVKE